MPNRWLPGETLMAESTPVVRGRAAACCCRLASVTPVVITAASRESVNWRVAVIAAATSSEPERASPETPGTASALIASASMASWLAAVAMSA